MAKFLVINILDYVSASIHQINVSQEYASKHDVNDIENDDTEDLVNDILDELSFRESDISFMVSVQELNNITDVVEPNVLICDEVKDL